MTFEQLRCFLAAAEYLNFTKAADSLFLSHSAISRNIANLEKSLGVELMERKPKGVELTPMGMLLKTNGSQLMDELNRLKFAIQNMKESRFALTVCSAGLYDVDLMKAIYRMRTDWPQALFAMREEQFVNVCGRVEQRYADVGFTYSFTMPENCKEELDVVRLKNEEFCVLVSENNPIATNGIITLQEMKNATVQAHDQAADSVEGVYHTRLFLQDIDSRSGLHSFHDNKSLSRNLEDLIFDVRTGNSLALLPKSLAEANCVGCRVLTVADFDTTYELVMVSRTDNKNPLLSVFQDYIIEEFEGGV